MEGILLKQILHEYDVKRNNAILASENRKKALLEVNPRLAEIEHELSTISIQTSKAILISNPNERKKLLDDLKKQTTKLIKEKNAFLKSLSKDSRIS